MSKRVLARSALGAVLLGAASCGGGGSGGSDGGPPPPPTPPFGIDTRPSLGPVTLPGSGSGTSFAAVNAFPALSGISQPVFAAGIPGEDRVVVIEKPGLVKAFANDATASAPRTILDLVGRVEAANEQGLLGLAFDPDFTANRFFYLYYSANPPRRSVISRFTWDADTDLATLASERVLLEIPQPDFDNHKAGMIAFGPDRHLYIAVGDGGSGGDPFGNGQSLDDLLGALLRIDVTPQDEVNAYDVPADNPFVADGDPATLGEIWAYGLRNPFRFSFDRQTGDLWLGDVGQNEFEEVDLITRGGNFGWCPWEGNQDFGGCSTTLPVSAFEFPIHTYGRSEGASVTGGVVYRGSALPSLVGQYVYGDFVSGRVWALTFDGTSVTANNLLDTVDGPVAFGEDNDGELLIVALNTNTLLRFEDTSGGGGTVPTLLSDTGIFTNTVNLAAASGFIEYDINLPFWSDAATKRRWIGVPDGQRITFSATGAWTFPVGTVIVQHFEIELIEGDPASARRLETRVLVNETGGWTGFTYRWNAMETDAVLLAGRETEVLTIETPTGPRQQTYEYPSRTDCLQCHNTAASSTLGVRTRQTNRDFDFPNAIDSQLRTYNHIQLFTSDIGSATQYEAFPDIADDTVPIATRARAYLDVNCAQCHRPGGPTPVDLDLRFDTADAAMNAIGVAPQAGDLGLTDAAIIAQTKESSVLWERMRRLDANRMPPLASHLVDQPGVDLIGEWIDGL